MVNMIFNGYHLKAYFSKTQLNEYIKPMEGDQL